MKLLLTGITGFVGQFLVKSLLDQGVDVVALVRSSTGISMPHSPELSFIVDSHQADKLHQDILDSGCQGVVHLASLFLKKHQASDAHDLVMSNIDFPTRLVEACQNTSVKWFLNTGTFWQHYQDKDYCPVNLYAATKQAFMDILTFYQETTPLIYATAKLSDTYGPGDTRPKLFHYLMTTSPGTPLNFSPGEQCLDLTYIRDVVSGFEQFISLLNGPEAAAHNGKSYTISFGDQKPLKEIVNTFLKMSGKNLDIKWGTSPYLAREVMTPWSCGIPLPGWKGTYPLERGISELLTYA